MSKQEAPNENETQMNIEVELSPELAEGVYSNLAIIHHSQAEFVVDFTRILPGVRKAKVQSRVVMTPQHLKLFLMALADNVNKYESQNGEIKLDNGNANSFGFMDSNSTIN